MLNRYPLWKNLIILGVLGLGLLYAMPNLYAPDPAIQISGRTSAQVMDQSVLSRALSALEQADIPTLGSELSAEVVRVRLTDREHQLDAKETVKRALGDQYVVALNMAPTTPDWLAGIGGQPMKLGLDLSGGVHFLMEVDIEAAIQTRLETTTTELRRLFRAEDARYQSVRLTGGNVIVASFTTAELRDKAERVVRSEQPNLVRATGEDGENYTLRLTMSEQQIQEIENYAITQNLTTLRRRVDALGVAEPIVQQQGSSRIVVELPGVQDTAEAKRIIGQTANLEFRLEAQPNALASTKERFEFRDPDEQQRWGSQWLEQDIIVTGDEVTNAQAGADQQTNRPQVRVYLSSQGGDKMYRATKDNIGRRMGALYIERIPQTTIRTNAAGEEVTQTRYIESKKLISLATIQDALSVQFVITNLSSPREASELALLLRSGALAAPMEFVEERTIGPSLGAENIALGVQSVVLGLALVVVFMLVYYKVFGIVANLALAMNVILIIAVMSIFNATLTMPGIAGIVLTVGMAVDANVLIYSRIREELRAGRSPQQAIHAGFDRAVVTILDANLTTLIVAFILWGIGSGPVKGFAVTLSIGIVTSMFTAIMGARALVNFIYGGRKVKKLLI